MKKAIMLLAAVTLFTVPVKADVTVNFLEQDVTLTALASMTVDEDTHAAHVLGTGTAAFDNGVTALKGSQIPIDITIEKAENDPLYQACQNSLTEGLSHGAMLNISGNGTYHVEMQDNTITKAVVTIQQLMGCTVS